ncbi:MAG: cobaltochelatase subunit CobT [Pseudomonadota bacterium]|nr:cobaltochelatase subunit CobT [Pseudomonadota bacterium]
MPNNQEKNIKKNFNIVTAALLRSLTKKNHHFEFEKIADHNFNNLTLSKSLKLPSPEKTTKIRNVDFLRGRADSLAMNICHHDDILHTKLKPKSPQEAKIFSAAEKARVDSIGITEFPGLKRNLIAAIRKFLLKNSLLTKKRKEITLDIALYLMVLKNLVEINFPKKIIALINKWEGKLSLSEKDKILSLKEHILDQEIFSQMIKKLISSLKLSKDYANKFSEIKTKPINQDREDPGSKKRTSDSSAGKTMSLKEKTEAMGLPGEDSSKKDIGNKIKEFGYLNLKERNINQSGITHLDKINNYKAYTKKFDEVVSADQLTSQNDLTELRKKLDNQIAELKKIITRLANKLQRRLLAKQERSWEYGLEFGYLDTQRFAQFIANPSNSNIYKKEKESDFKDTVVSLLIDNSGSMRGRPITIAAICADILSRTLERCGVKVEILGFTTKNLKGGKCREKWVADDKPESPGRLNDLRHIIYKSADVPWRRISNNLGAMLQEGLLKENVDGEAIIWACKRLLLRSENRRILMVISDGAPVDDSTLASNSTNILENHLKETISWIESNSPIELLAIGIGHDVTNYYGKAVTINDVEKLAKTMTEELIELFDS